MDKKQTDRRPDEKPATQNPGRPDVTKPDAARRPPGDSAERKGFPKPEGNPIDKQMPKPGGGSGGKDIFESERSDRESGRPVQLEDDNEPEGGRPQEGSEDRKHYQAGQPKR